MDTPPAATVIVSADQCGLARDASPFVRNIVSAAIKDRSLDVIDVPCGFGRHSVWLAHLGHRVTGVDISPDRVLRAGEAARAHQVSATFLTANAEHPLPFAVKVFDLALIVHFASERLLQNLVPILRGGGLLAYETFGGHGRNWIDLPRPGIVRSLLTPHFDLLHYHERLTGPATDRVALKVIARKR